MKNCVACLADLGADVWIVTFGSDSTFCRKCYDSLSLMIGALLKDTVARSPGVIVGELRWFSKTPTLEKKKFRYYFDEPQAVGKKYKNPIVISSPPITRCIGCYTGEVNKHNCKNLTLK